MPCMSAEWHSFLFRRGLYFSLFIPFHTLRLGSFCFLAIFSKHHKNINHTKYACLFCTTKNILVWSHLGGKEINFNKAWIWKTANFLALSSFNHTQKCLCAVFSLKAATRLSPGSRIWRYTCGATRVRNPICVSTSGATRPSATQATELNTSARTWTRWVAARTHG